MGLRSGIDGVRERRLEQHLDARGSLTEVLRSDWPEFSRFGQAIVTINLPGVIRAWHWHHKQTDVIVVMLGRAVLALYDARQGSPTFGEIEERVADGSEPFALVVPPGVYHGYKTTGSSPALILNFPDQLYDPARPDEERVPYDSPAIPYDWSRQR